MEGHQLNISIVGSDGQPGKPLALHGATDDPDVGDRLALNDESYLVIDVAHVVEAGSRSGPAAMVTWVYARKLDVPPSERPRSVANGLGSRDGVRRPVATERLFVVDVDRRERRARLRIVAPVLPVLPATLPPTSSQLLQGLPTTTPPAPSSPLPSSLAPIPPATGALLPAVPATSSPTAARLLPVLPATIPPTAGPLLPALLATMPPAPAVAAGSRPRASRPTLARGIGGVILTGLLLVAIAAFAFTATLALGKYRRRRAEAQPPSAIATPPAATASPAPPSHAPPAEPAPSSR